MPAFLGGVLLLVGCFEAGLENRVAANPPAHTAAIPLAIGPADYVGTWRAPADGGLIESEWGPVRKELTLRGDGTLELVQEIIDSPGGDGTFRISGKYDQEQSAHFQGAFPQGAVRYPDGKGVAGADDRQRGTRHGESLSARSGSGELAAPKVVRSMGQRYGEDERFCPPTNTDVEELRSPRVRGIAMDFSIGVRSILPVCLVGALFPALCCEAHSNDREAAIPPGAVTTVPSANGPAAYVGTWRAPPDGWIEGESGPTRCQLTLGGDGQFTMDLVISDSSPGGGGKLHFSGAYEIKDGRLVGRDLPWKEACDIRLENGLLVLTLSEPTETYRFRRVPEVGQPQACGGATGSPAIRCCRRAPWARWMCRRR
jgi:hypothetical protein